MWSRRDTRLLKNTPCNTGGSAAVIPPSSKSSRLSASSTAGLDPAARQVPARDVTVLDEEQTALRVDYDRLHTQRHAAGKARIEMQTTLDCGGV